MEVLSPSGEGPAGSLYLIPVHAWQLKCIHMLSTSPMPQVYAAFINSDLVAFGGLQNRRALRGCMCVLLCNAWSKKSYRRHMSQSVCMFSSCLTLWDLLRLFEIPDPGIEPRPFHLLYWQHILYHCAHVGIQMHQHTLANKITGFWACTGMHTV